MKKIITPISILIVAILLVFSCKVDHRKNKEAKPIEQKNFVKIESVEAKTTPIPIQAIGRLGSDKEVKLSFKIGGIISSIRVDEGDLVRKGMLLATMRTNEIDAQVLKAERALQKVERDLERTENMYKDSVATLENVQDLTTLLQVSQEDVKIAKFNQQYSKIIAPVTGRVVRRLSEPSELVGGGQPILMIAASGGSSYVMKVALSDKDINRVKYGSAAKIQFDAFPNEVFEGNVITVAENSDPMTGTFEVEININSGKTRLRNGYIGQVEINPIQNESYLQVPIQAVVEGDKKQVTIFVPTSEDTIAQELLVEPFHITNDFIYIKNPKEFEVEKVVTVGAAYLVDGDRIYIK